MSSEGIEAEYLAWIGSDQFTCLGARAAARRQVTRLVEPGPIGESGTTASLHDAMREFVRNVISPDENFTTLVAIFDDGPEVDEQEFDRIFWRQLQALHDLDATSYAWAEGVSSDPESPNFSFSLIGHPFFVVGMHPAASRISRRFRRPAMAFNSHRQFDRLRAAGAYSGLKTRIRTREIDRKSVV